MSLAPSGAGTRVIRRGLLALLVLAAASAEAASVIATIPVGSNPHGVGVNPATQRIYVANMNSNNVSVIDGTTLSVIATIPVGLVPFGVGVNPSTNRIYVSNRTDNTLSVIDGATNLVLTTIGVGTSPEDVAVNPVTNKIYVANRVSDNVTVINGLTNTVIATIPVGNFANGVSVNTATNRVYVTNFSSDSVSVINGATDTFLTTIPLPGGAQPNGVDVNSSTNRIYVTNFGLGSVSVINGATDTIVATVTVGANPDGVAVNAFLNRVYVSNTGPDTVSIIDGGTNTVLETLPVGTDPREVDAHAAAGRFYVANHASSTVSVLEDPSPGACCAALATSQGAGTLTVTAPGSFEMTFATATGGGIQLFYDLAEDPSRINDLAGGISTQSGLVGEGYRVGGIWHDTYGSSGNARLHLLEATRARVKVRQESFYEESPGSVVLAGPKAFADYSIYPAGRIGLRWNRRTTSAFSYERNDHDLTVHLAGVPPLDSWNPYTESGTVFPNLGTDDFLLVVNEAAGARTDFLQIAYRDWTVPNGYVADADEVQWVTTPANESGNAFWRDDAVTPQAIGANTSEVWNFLAYFKPTNFMDNLDAAVTARRTDYRSPDSLAVFTGSPWLDASENTGGIDHFNESEAAYPLNLDMASGLVFDIDGAAAARYKPFYKIRNWRSLSSTPLVTFTGSQSTWKVTEQTGSPLPNDDQNLQDDTLRQLIEAPFIRRSGSQIRIKLRGHRTQAGLNLTNFHIAEVDAADDRDVVDGTWTLVTFAGGSTVTVPAGGSVWSDWIAFNLDETKTYSITFFLPANTYSAEWASPTPQKYYFSFADQSNTLDWAGLGPLVSSRADFFEDIEVRGTVNLVANQDFRSDLKPISRAHWASTLTWHCTVETPTACDPSVGNLDVGSAGGQVGVTIVPAKYGNGAEFNSNTDAVSAGTSGSLDFNAGSGSIDFWYRPYYDSNEGSPPRRVLWENEGIGPDYFMLERTNLGELKFTIQNTGGASASTTVSAANFSWRAFEWVHIRTFWKSNGLAGDRLRIYLNGVAPPQVVSGTYDGIGMNKGPTYFGGCAGACPGGLNGHANGVIDEPHIYTGAVDNPSILAYAGLSANGSEFLGDANRNFSLGFLPVDGSRRGHYLFLGADSKFRGLNVALASPGTGTVDLRWEYWNGAAWADLEAVAGFTDQTNHLTRDGTVFWTADPAGWSPYSVAGEPDLFYVRVSLTSGPYTLAPMERLIKTDILLFQYCLDLTQDAQRFNFAPPTPTAVELSRFEARGLDGAVELLWQTASELNNLGFHLYRAPAADGPYGRITSRAIAGLGSSPVGASYRYLDGGVENGVTYYYKLEDIETTGRTEMHGPVTATPSAAAGAPPGGEPGAGTPAAITYGRPEVTELRILESDGERVVLELVTGGFYAFPQPDGEVRFEIPGFDEGVGSPALPLKRAWVEAVAGRRVRLASVRVGNVEAVTGLLPAGNSPELDARWDGTVRASTRRQRSSLIRSQAGMHPEELARLVSVGFQGETKKALVEMAPLRWDGTSGRLLLAKRLVVVLSFRGRDPGDQSEDGVRGRRYRRTASHENRSVAARLVTRERGLYAVRYDDLLGRRGSLATSSLRLSRLGETRAFYVQPDAERFVPGSTLFFFSEGASANTYGGEAIFELETSAGGARLAEAISPLSGTDLRFYWQELAREENRFYQAGLLEARDLWLWDLLFAPASQSYSFTLSQIASASEPARLSLWLQGASDFPTELDHHLRVSVNGAFLAEKSWDGKRPVEIQVDLTEGVLQEGENFLQIENVGDTEAIYSMVFLDRFTLRYPRRIGLENGVLEGEWSATGALEVAADYVVDLTKDAWVRGQPTSAGTMRFNAEAGHRYFAVSKDGLLKPEVRRVPKARLKSEHNGADYLLIGPSAFLQAASPLIELRRSQGLGVAAVAMEAIYSEFGFGESRPEALRDFLTYAYHRWRKPSPRYVVLLGDGTYDFKGYLATGATNLVPPLLAKTSYLWTSSDPTYACVNGEDGLPDLALGRIPAASLEEARRVVNKIVAYENGQSNMEGPLVLVADNADAAGDFESDAEALANGVLAGKPVERVYLGRLGPQATRLAISEALDAGASLLSYVGHGGIHLWASENVFDSSAVGLLSPQPRQPIVLTLNCLNGYWHFPYFNALAEELLKADGKGAIAAFSPSGLSLNQPAHLYHQALLREIFQGGHARLGDAVLAAQTAYAGSGAFPELLSIYHLLGDPALRLR